MVHGQESGVSQVNGQGSRIKGLRSQGQGLFYFIFTLEVLTLHDS